jgi:hypothetical protein
MAGRRELVRVGTCAGLIALAGGAIGCSKSGDSSWFSSRSGATVHAGDFAADAAETTETAPTPAKPEHTKLPVTPVGEAHVIGTLPSPVMNLGGNGAPGQTVTPARSKDLQTTVGTPTMGPAPNASGTAATVESVVGQINGRPVFASEVLEPLDGALRASAEKAKDVNSWQKAAAEAIVPELKRRVADELILSEARRNLSPEQKQGLLHFLGQIQGALISQNSGSEVKADEQLREQNGRSLGDEARDIVDKELIRNELNNKVTPRVAVPWRDVQNEYERQHDKWYPPTEFTFRLIYAPTDKPESVTRIQTLLAAGTPFEKVAEDAANEFNRREQGKLVRKTQVAQAEGEFSPWPDVNTALRTVGVGQTVGPIVFAPDKNNPEVKRTAWVYLDKVDQKPGTSLYDAQLDVEQELRDERTTAEQQRYFERLWKRGNVSQLELMVDKLMVVATERYAPRFKGK